MQYDDQKARASRILDPDRKPKMVANLDEYEKEIEHTPAKVYTRIKGNAILAIIDSGAGTSVITKPLAVALGLRWKPTNRRDMVTIDSQKQGIVGELDEVDVCIADARTTIKMYMVGSTTKTLLLGINWITKYKADILGSIKKLRFIYQGKPMEVDLFTQRPPVMVYQTSEGHSTDEYEAIFTTIFEEDYKWKNLKEGSSKNIENCTYYINDKIQETDWSERANNWYIPANLELKDRPLYLLTLEPRSEQTSTMKKEFENIAKKYKGIITEIGRAHV